MQYKIYATLGALALLGGGVMYGLEFNWFNRTIGMPGLVRYAILVGVLIGLGIGWTQQHQRMSLVERIQIYIFFVAIFGVFAPLLASLTNRLLTFQPVEYVPVEVVEEKAFYASRTPPIKGEEVKATGYYLFFYYRDELRRIKNEKSYLRGREAGTEIQLPMQKGLWGYYVVLQPEE